MPTSNTDYESFQAGDRVKHPKFGEGTIMQRSGAGKQIRFVVTFAEEGEKYLMARYAKLRKITPISTRKDSKTDEAAEKADENIEENEIELADMDEDELELDEEDEEEDIIDDLDEEEDN